MTMFPDGSRALQDRYDTRRLADRIEEKLASTSSIRRTASSWSRATCSSSPRPTRRGRPTCFHEGGDRGFVRVVDEPTLAFPNHNGDSMFLSMGDVRENPEVGHPTSTGR